jgi:hypothetical protein
MQPRGSTPVLQSLSRHVLHPQVLQAVQQLRGVDLKQQQMKQDFHYLYLLTTLRARRAYGVSPGMCGMVHQRCTKCLAEYMKPDGKLLHCIVSRLVWIAAV